MPFKPQAAAVAYILDKEGWSRTEALFVGNSDVDMKTARNGGVLFLNARWHGRPTHMATSLIHPKTLVVLLIVFAWVCIVGFGRFKRAICAFMRSRHLQHCLRAMQSPTPTLPMPGQPQKMELEIRRSGAGFSLLGVYLSGLVDEIITLPHILAMRRIPSNQLWERPLQSSPNPFSGNTFLI